jgi:hypothetical protein
MAEMMAMMVERKSRLPAGEAFVAAPVEERGVPSTTRLPGQGGRVLYLPLKLLNPSCSDSYVKLIYSRT